MVQLLIFLLMGATLDAAFADHWREMQAVYKSMAHTFKKNIIAIWHDESHINRYFIDNPPTIILSPSYCYPENLKLPYKKRLLALDKNHAKVRR